MENKISNHTKTSTFLIGFGALFFAVLFLAGWHHHNVRKKLGYEINLKSDLKNLRVEIEIYFADHQKYSKDISFSVSPSVTIEIASMDEKCFKAKGNHTKLDETYWIDCEGKLYRQEKGSSELNLL